MGGTVAPHVRSRNSAVRVTAQAWNDASNCGPDCELLFFLMKREPDLTERHVSAGSLFACSSSRKHSFPLELTTRVGEQALCVLYTQGLHAPKLFFSMDLIRGVTHVLKVIVCVY